MVDIVSVAVGLPLLIAAFVLGLAHGFVPDEHSWTPLFPYVIGAKRDSDMVKAHAVYGLAHIITWIPLFAVTAIIGKIIINTEDEYLITIFGGSILLALGVYSYTHPKHIHLDQEIELVRGPLVLGIIMGLVPCLFTLAMLGLVLISGNLVLAIIAAVLHGVGVTIGCVAVGWVARQGVHQIERKAGRDICEKFGTLGSYMMMGSGILLYILAAIDKLS